VSRTLAGKGIEIDVVACALIMKQLAGLMLGRPIGLPHLPEDERLLDPSGGTAVRWVEGQGWIKEPA
jgi:hypothetical protein